MHHLANQPNFREAVKFMQSLANQLNSREAVRYANIINKEAVKSCNQ